MSASSRAVPATGPQRFWEDLEVGETTLSRVMTVDLADMLAYARRYDPQWFHADPEAARTSLFGEVVASGLYTAALWRVLDHEVNGDIAWVCGVGWDDVRWIRAVRAGDGVQARSEILSKRPSASRPGVGVAVLAHALSLADGTRVFEFRSTNLAYRREAEA